MSQTQSRSDIGVGNRPLIDLARSAKRSLMAVLNIVRYRALVNRQDLPKPARSILVICKGNICRSPLAEAYLKALIEKYSLPTIVQSAGLETSFGKPAHRFAQVVGAQGGLLLDHHTTQPLHRDQVERADIILVMEWQQRSRVLKLYPQARRKVFLLRQFYDHSVREVVDPYSGTLEDFHACFSMIRQACDVLVAQMLPANK
jgi:protein-tyrosine phosphatase